MLRNRIFYRIIWGVLILIIVLILSCCAKNNEHAGVKFATNSLERAVYHFKMGETYNSAEESYKAMEEFLEAERWSRDIKNDLLKGQISWYKGKLYFDRLDYTNALNMFTLASEYFALANSKLDLMNTYEQMALVCSKKNNLEDAIIFFNKSIMLAQEQKSAEINKLNNNDTTAIVVKYNRIILGFSTALSGVYYNKLNSPQQAIESLNIAYDKYAGGVAQEQDFLLLSCIYLDAGNINLSRDYANKYILYKKNISPIERAGVILHKSNIEKRADNFKDALALRERYDIVMDSIARVDNNSSIREMEQQFWQKQLQLENETIRLSHTYTITIYSLVVLILLILGYMFFIIYRRRLLDKNKQLEEYVAMISELDNRVNSAEKYKENLLGQLNVHIKKEKELKDLLENRFMEVRELVRTYYEFGNSKKLQKKVEDLLKLQLSGDNFETIEQVVNAKNNNIIKRIRENNPTLKEENIKLLNLIYAGFSAQEISVILNDTPQNIYVRKSRLKKVISAIEEVDF